MVGRFPVFVVGSPRSGTSILVDALLSSGYVGFREGNFLPLISSINQVIDRHSKIFGDPKVPVLAANVDFDDLKKRIQGLFKKIVDELNPTDGWFDKSGNPDMINVIPELRKLWPESVYIFARRRGIENVSSRLKKFPGHGFDYHCTDWARNMSAWRAIRSITPSSCYIEIDQQDIIQSPEKTAETLGGLLGIDEHSVSKMAATMLNNRPQETVSGSASRVLTLAGSGWSETQQATFLRICAAEMVAYDYTFDEAYSNAGSSMEPLDV